MAASEAPVGFDPVDREPLDPVRQGLQRASSVLAAHGLPVPRLAGKLLRPQVAYAMVPANRHNELDDRFWLGALAIQMVHEASLLHDDVLDGATERRGHPTEWAEQGIGVAVVTGDHYLVAAYRAALWTRSPEFLERFIVCVERTVAGEVLQGRHIGEWLGLDTYFTAILGKSGELLKAAGSLGACVLDLTRVDERARIGLHLGAFYQQVDDLLDYCAGTGKEPLLDYRQKKWTWVLELAGIKTWDASEADVLDAVFERGDAGISVAERAISYLEVRRSALTEHFQDLLPEADLLGEIVDGWIDAAREGVSRQLEARATRVQVASAPARPSAEATVMDAASRLADPVSRRRYFVTHARTFSFASRLFPPRDRRRIETLYAYSRFTDDLVDDPGDDADALSLGERLHVWRQLSRSSYLGETRAVALLDEVMHDARASGVDWLYPQALLDGVEMDLTPKRYEDWSDLARYTFCVAGAVGGWMTHLFGARERDTLARAHSLGHAMQLTNILRDVGEDLGMGRLYLPRTLLTAHGITVDELLTWRTWDTRLPERYVNAMLELEAAADERYAEALPGIQDLPASARHAVAVAAEAYRGIHAEVRRNGYDNLRLRARTSASRKAYLGLRGISLARKGRPASGQVSQGRT